jgi:hypothetical protein
MESVKILKKALNVDSLKGSGVEEGIPKSWAAEPKNIVTSVDGIEVHIRELKAKKKIGADFSADRILRSKSAYEALAELESWPDFSRGA